MLVARRATPGLYCDTNWKITPSVVAALLHSTYLGVGRYLPLPGLRSSADITAQELADITGPGLACWPVQHPRRPPWDPGAHSGSDDAKAALEVLQSAGFALGTHVFLDLEGIQGASTPTSTLVFADSWQQVLVAAGYRVGVYVGFASSLSSRQLYDMRVFNQYWSDWGHRLVDVRGCSIEQKQTVTLAGIGIDPDQVANDALGDLPYFTYEVSAAA